ncbi:MAG: hypothetical protein C4B58_11795 [Deltaproteobacteria bacterium]|nr:MAG: hypothetical protein C4B58_11795 [Deltaproteobacteria bacterium]
MKPRREKIITYQQVVVPIPKKTILGDSFMNLGHWSASLGYNSLIFKDLNVVPKEPHPNQGHIVFNKKTVQINRMTQRPQMI